MPRLPISSQQLDVGSGRFAAPGFQERRDFTGQQLQQMGQGLMQASSVAIGEGQRQRERFDDAVANERLNRFLEFDLNSRASYGQKLGKAAVQEHELLEKSYREMRAKVAEGLDPVQLELLEPQLDRAVMRGLAQAQAHRDEQGLRWRVGEAESGWKRRTEQYGSFVDNPQEAARLRAEALAMVDEQSDLMGHGPEQNAALRMQATTAMHGGVLNKYLAMGRSDLARDYLSKVPEGEMDPKQLARARSMVQDATDSDHAAQLADFFYGRGMSFDDAEQSAQQLYERKEISLAVRDGAVDRHRARLRNQQNERDRVRSTTLRDAADFAAVNRATVVSFETLPPEMQTALKQSGGADAMRTFFARGGQRITTAAGQNFMADVAANPARLRQFPTVDALQAALFNDLDADDMRRASEYWGKVTAPGKPSDTLDDGQVTTSIYLKMRDAGLIPNEARGEDPAQKQAAADRAKRLQLAVEMEAKIRGGEHWRSKKHIDDAWKAVAGQTIYDANDALVPMAMLSEAELNNPADPAYWMTSSGVRVEHTAMSMDAQMKALAAIREHNEDLAAYNTAHGYKPGDPRYRTPVEESMVQVAEELGRERKALADKMAAEKKAAEAVEAERIKTKGRYRGPMQDTFGSPWGRK